MADSWRDRFVKTDVDSIAFDESLTGAYRWSFEMENIGDTPIIGPSTNITTQYPLDRFTYFEPGDVSVNPSGSGYQYSWSFPEIPTGSYGADIYMESNLPITFSPGFDSERIISPLLLLSDQVTQTATVYVTPHEEYQRILVTISADETELTSGALVSAPPRPTPDVLGSDCYFETGSEYAQWNCLGAQVGTTYTFTAEFLVTNKVYPSSVEYKPRVRVHGQHIIEYSSDLPQGTSLTRTDDVLGEIVYSANEPYAWSYLARDRWTVIYRPLALSQEPQTSVLADLWRERFIRTDSDSIAYDASLTGAYRWSLAMDSDEPDFPVIVAPQTSVTTQYDPDHFYFEPGAVTSDSYQYSWSFDDISAGGYGANTDVESDFPVTFSPGFDSERIISPLLLSSSQVTQTVTVHVTPQMEYQRIIVTISADTTDLTSGALVPASPLVTPVPQGGCDLDSGPEYFTWNCRGAAVGTTYTFTAEFVVNNNIYPTIVEHKPRVIVRGQLILDSESGMAQGSSLTVTDDLLGDITYSATGEYSWNYFARDRWTVIYRSLASGSIPITPPTAATPEEIENAIEDGVAYLANQQNADGSWGSGETCQAYTGLVLMKLQMRAYELGYDSPFDPEYPYSSNVVSGWQFLFSAALKQEPLSPQDHTLGASGTLDNPDTNGNGYGIFWPLYQVYATGIVLMALEASGTPDRPNDGAIDFDGDGSPDTFKEIAQDTADWLALAQGDSGNDEGGWGYVGLDNQMQNDWTDNSNGGYAVLGLAAAEGFGCTVPEWVRTELNVWMTTIQDKSGGTDDGGSHYNPDDPPQRWANMLRSGNLIFQMAFCGDSADDSRFDAATDYVVRHWQDMNVNPGWGYGISPSNYQAMFSLMKGFEYSGIDLIDLDGDGTPEHDWYEEFAAFLVVQQHLDGSWYMGYGDYGEPVLGTVWALLTLEKVAPPPSQFTLTVNVVGGGSVTKTPDQLTYNYNDGVTLAATADLGWGFAGWSGDLSGSTNPTTITMTGNKAVTATFIDKTPPTIVVTVPTAYGIYAATSGSTYQFSVTDNLDSHPLFVATETDYDGNVRNVYPGTPLPTSSGVYTVAIVATDQAGNTATRSVLFVVYDPSAGFVTGGGWIIPEPAIGAHANFGFVAKYKKGSTVPDGNLEFQYQYGDINLKSTSIDWLVISNNKAIFQGTATINGQGTYKFRVEATDGDLTGGQPDSFMIKIWLGADGEAQPLYFYKGDLQGGNVVVHKH